MKWVLYVGKSTKEMQVKCITSKIAHVASHFGQISPDEAPQHAVLGKLWKAKLGNVMPSQTHNFLLTASHVQEAFYDVLTHKLPLMHRYTSWLFTCNWMLLCGSFGLEMCTICIYVVRRCSFGQISSTWRCPDVDALFSTTRGQVLVLFCVKGQGCSKFLAQY